MGDNGKKLTEETRGRKSLYKPKYCEEIIRFFDEVELTRERVKQTGSNKHGEYEMTEEVANELPTLNDFARKIGVSYVTVWSWTKKHREFLNAYNSAKELQHDFLIKNALCGRYNAAFAIFTMKNISNWKDRTDPTVLIEDHKHFVNINIKELEAKNELDLINTILGKR